MLYAVCRRVVSALSGNVSGAANGENKANVWGRDTCVLFVKLADTGVFVGEFYE